MIRNNQSAVTYPEGLVIKTTLLHTFHGAMYNRAVLSAG